LFHEPEFDCAMILLEPCGRGPPTEMSDKNDTSLAILYFITEAEDHKVEFEVDGGGLSQHLSRGAEAMVPPGAAYILRNLSRSTSAKLITVVPYDPSP